jgi:hypothetical protein
MTRRRVTERAWFQWAFIGGLTLVACALGWGVLLWPFP